MRGSLETPMPAAEIMKKFRAGTLHSGRNGPIVKKKSQAKAIQISYARKEGHHIPYPSEKSKRLAKRRG